MKTAENGSSGTDAQTDLLHHLRYARPLDRSGRQQSARLVQENIEKRQHAAEGLADRKTFLYFPPRGRLGCVRITLGKCCVNLESFTLLT